MRSKTCILALGTVVLCSDPLAAQLWDAPSFLPPRPTDDLGLYVFEPTDGDWALSGIWRQSGNLNLGVRAGIASREDRSGESERSVLVGAESYGPLLGAGEGSPVDVWWTLGAGAALDGGTFLRIPAGVTIGVPFGAENFVVVPYVHPRLALEVFADDDTSETDFAWTADVGADLLVGSSFVVRLGASFGDVFGGNGAGALDDPNTAFGAGVAYRMGRGVAVR